MNTHSVRYLALGDSYTIGESVEPSERWPRQLAERLRGSGIDVGEPELIARTAWTTDELSAAIDRAKPTGPYQLVTLLIGVNNQYRGRSLDEFRTQFAGLLKRAVGFAGDEPRRVIVVSIPDWGVTPFAKDRDRAKIAAETDAFNEICRAEAIAAGARFVDITPISRKAATDPAQSASDGLHPSAKMYEKWVEIVLPEAKAAVKNGG